MLRSLSASISAILVVLSMSDGHPVPTDDTWAEMTSSPSALALPQEQLMTLSCPYYSDESAIKMHPLTSEQIKKIHDAMKAAPYPNIPQECSICNNQHAATTDARYPQLSKELSKAECKAKSGCRWQAGKMLGLGKGSCEACKSCDKMLSENWLESSSYRDKMREWEIDRYGRCNRYC